MMSDIFLVDTSLDTLISQMSPPPPIEPPPSPSTDSDGVQPTGEDTPLSEADQDITVFILDDTESAVSSNNDDNKDDMTWLIVLVVIIVLFIIILLLLAFWWYIKKVRLSYYLIAIHSSQLDQNYVYIYIYIYISYQ